MQTLTIRHGDGLVAVLLDDADHNLIAHLPWRVGTGGYVDRKVGQTYRVLHREILGLSVGDGVVVDHINGDLLDNRRENLRIGTQGQNLQNVRARGGSSAHRGVTWDAQYQKWKAQAKLDGKNHHLGRFDTEQEAADAAQAWRAQHMPWAVSR